MSTVSSRPDWITYVPRRVYDAARRLEAACERCGCPSPIGVAEYRSDFRPTQSARVFWYQVWLYMMEDHNVSDIYAIKFVIVDDPAFDSFTSLTPKELN